MKKLRAPTSDAGWRQMASALIKANLQLARMNYGDLSHALNRIGVNEPAKHISAKLVRGSFSAVFFLQVLSVIGVEQLSLPEIDDVPTEPTI